MFRKLFRNKKREAHFQEVDNHYVKNSTSSLTDGLTGRESTVSIDGAQQTSFHSVRVLDVQSPGRFCHQPFSQSAAANPLRLLVVHPAARVDIPLNCSILHSTLSEIGGLYSALSYTWGDATTTRPMWVNNQLFHATKSLEGALRHLRHQSETRLIWADAICIDQTNVEERNQQVAQMNLIYGRASSVFVWLCEEEIDLVSVVRLMETIVAVAESGEAAQGMAALLANSSYSIAWKSFSQVMSQSWWSRTWIIQEVVLPQCPIWLCAGSQRVAFSSILKFADMSKKHIDCLYEALLGPRPEAGFVNVEDALAAYTTWSKFGNSLFEIRRNRAFPETNNLYATLTASSAAVSTDPRDKIYALLGLIDPQQASLIEIDYRKSRRDVYIEAAKHMLEVHNRPLFLDALTTPNVPKSPEERLPSWTPDWSRPRQTMMSELVNRGSRNFKEDTALYNAAPEKWAGSHHIKVSHGVLAIHSIRIASIGAMTPECESINDALSPDTRKLLQLGDTPHDRDIFWRIVLADRWRPGAKVPVRLQSMIPLVSYIPPRTAQQEARLIEAHNNILQPDIYRRSLFISSDGLYRGLVPALAQPEDQIFIIYGANVPHVLRPLGNKSFYYIGPSYVHYMMDGQVIHGLDDGRFESKVIVLR